jgi:hypothetical protein
MKELAVCLCVPALKIFAVSFAVVNEEANFKNAVIYAYFSI